MDRYVWMDLEMTGLDVINDVIVEIATVITDCELNIIAKGPNYVIHRPESVLTDLNPWVEKTHTESGLLTRIRESNISHSQAEQDTLDFIKRHTAVNTAPLCGNSIGTDRGFLQQHMPSITDHLHYRNIDVTSVKILYEAMHSHAKPFEKNNTHRALDDILESIAELQYYSNVFFKKSSDV
ncbi:MAG: oligoribonuclease [Pseudomonadota bacterium]|nr:oligoribonuclease [Pseudomonadota bacterium]